MAPMMAASTRPRLTGEPKSTAGRTNTGRASSPPMPRKEKAVRPPTASVGSMPLTASIRNWAAAPAAAPPGTIKRDGVAGQLGGDHREPGLGAQGDALEREGADEVGPLGHQRGDEPEQVERDQLGPGVEHGDELGQHQVEGHPGDDHHDRPLDEGLPREGLILLLLELGLERPGPLAAGALRRVGHPAPSLSANPLPLLLTRSVAIIPRAPALRSHLRFVRCREVHLLAWWAVSDTTDAQLTRDTYDRLQAELEDLTTRGRVEIAAAIESARALGDLSENGDYHAAKDAQGKMESRIRQLQRLLKTATVVDASQASDGTVAPGTVVTLRYEGDDEDETTDFFVGSIEERQGDLTVVSPGSPLGQALLGHSAGDAVEYAAPGGTLKVEIVNVGTEA